MNNKVKIMVAPILLTLAACSSSDGEGTGTTTVVKSVRGDDVSLSTNSWSGECRLDTESGKDMYESLTFSSNSTVKYEQLYYPASSPSPSCSGTPESIKSYEANVTVSANTSAIEGWMNGSRNTVSAPMARNNSGPLSDTESFTDLTYTFTAINGLTGSTGPVVGQSVHFFYIVDDTTIGTTILYRGEYSNETALTGARAQATDSFAQ